VFAESSKTVLFRNRECPFGKEALLGVEAKKCWAVRRLFV
jgi:hypothetical protein